MSSAFNMFAKTVVREQRIPFTLTTETPNETTVQAMMEYEDMEKHPEKYKSYTSFQEVVNEVLENA